jgi:hypothetical protein
MLKRSRPAALLHRSLHVYRCPAAHRSHRVCRMRRIDEHHRFIGKQLVQQGLLLPVEFARYHRRLAVFHAKAM